MNITARRNQQRAQLVRVLEEAHEPRPMRHSELHLPADQRCICKTTLVASPALTHETIIHRHVPSSLSNVAVPSTPLSNPVQPREENKEQSRLSSSPGERSDEKPTTDQSSLAKTSERSAVGQTSCSNHAGAVVPGRTSEPTPESASKTTSSREASASSAEAAGSRTEKTRSIALAADPACVKPRNDARA